MEGEKSTVKKFGTFVFPQIHDNMDGWGPCEVPEQFRDTPYQPFSKDDRLGKVKPVCIIEEYFKLSLYRLQTGLAICTLTEDQPVSLLHKAGPYSNMLTFRSSQHTDKYVNVYGLGGQTYTYHHEQDESTFQLVDTAKIQKPLYQKGRPRFNQVSEVKHLLDHIPYMYVSYCKWQETYM